MEPTSRFPEDAMERLYDHALHALANPVRRRILSRLLKREGTAAELATEMPSEATHLAYHLRALRDGGFIVAHRLPTRRSVYRARSSLFREIVLMLRELEH